MIIRVLGALLTVAISTFSPISTGEIICTGSDSWKNVCQVVSDNVCKKANEFEAVGKIGRKDLTDGYTLQDACNGNIMNVLVFERDASSAADGGQALGRQECGFFASLLRPSSCGPISYVDMKRTIGGRCGGLESLLVHEISHGLRDANGLFGSGPELLGPPSCQTEFTRDETDAIRSENIFRGSCKMCCMRTSYGVVDNDGPVMCGVPEPVPDDIELDVFKVTVYHPNVFVPAEENSITIPVSENTIFSFDTGISQSNNSDLLASVEANTNIKLEMEETGSGGIFGGGGGFVGIGVEVLNGYSYEFQRIESGTLTAEYTGMGGLHASGVSTKYTTGRIQIAALGHLVNNFESPTVPPVPDPFMFEETFNQIGEVPIVAIHKDACIYQQAYFEGHTLNADHNHATGKTTADVIVNVRGFAKPLLRD